MLQYTHSPPSLGVPRPPPLRLRSAFGCTLTYGQPLRVQYLRAPKFGHAGMYVQVYAQPIRKTSAEKQKDALQRYYTRWNPQAHTPAAEWGEDTDGDSPA